MRAVILLAMALMVAEVYATHYRGGTFYWERLGKSKVRVYWRLSFQLINYYPEYFCKNIGDHLIAENVLALTCIDCASNNTILTPLTLECTSISQKMGWSLLDGYVDYQADRKVFTMGFMTTDKCTDSSWIKLENYGAGKCWSLLTKVDTSKPNDSPRVTAGLPVYRVRHGCKRLIDLNPIDINGDPTKCRWAKDDECPEGRDSSDVDRVCGQATSLTKLYEEECKIEFITGDDDLQGWYGASVMIEDFSDTTFRKAKSTVPFQFLLDVTAPGSCVGPKIDLEECSVIQPGETWNSHVTALIQEGSDASTITEIQGSYPNGMKMSYVRGSEPSQKIVKAKLSFTPKKEGTYVFSFTATDDNGVQNDPKSGRLIVSYEVIIPPSNPEIIPDKSYPKSNEDVDVTVAYWFIKFDGPVSRPGESAYIKVLDSSYSKEIARYDSSNPDEVQFPADDPTIARYQAPKDLEAGEVYFIKIEEDFKVVKYSKYCGDRPGETRSIFIYSFSTPTPPKPQVDCDQNEITAYVPKSYVSDLSVNELHLIDPRCKSKDNGTHLIVKFAYDSCGTYIKKKSSDLTRFINILRDDPGPYKTSNDITRKKRQVNMKIICDVKGVGIANVVFNPDTSVTSEKFKSTTTLEAYLELHEDKSYSTMVQYGTEKSAEFSDRLYFAARADDSSKEVAIESCRATAQYKTCSKYDKKFEFISNGCPVDDTVKFTNSGSFDQKRFSIKTFAMIDYGLDDTVWVTCSFITCDPSNSQSACKDLNSPTCDPASIGRRRRKRSATDVVTQAFLEVQIDTE